MLTLRSTTALIIAALLTNLEVISADIQYVPHSIMYHYVTAGARLRTSECHVHQHLTAMSTAVNTNFWLLKTHLKVVQL